MNTSSQPLPRVAIVAPEVTRRFATYSALIDVVSRLADSYEFHVFARRLEGLSHPNVRFHRVPVFTEYNIFGYLNFLISSTVMMLARRLVLGERFDVIHSTGGDSFLATVMTCHFCHLERLRLERAQRPPTSVRERVRRYLRYGRLWIEAALEGAMIARPALHTVICVSNGLKEHVTTHYGRSADTIVVIPNGVDTALFRPDNRALYRQEVRKSLQLSEHDIISIFAGTDWYRKGLRQCIEALPYVTNPDHKLLVLGCGDLPEYRRLAERLGVIEKVRFIGHHPHDQMNKLFAVSDIFVFPTLYEAHSLAVLEAAAGGLPIVVTRVDGTDFLSDGVSALFVERDGADVAAKLNLLCDSAGLRDMIGAAAAKAAQSLSWDAAAAKTAEVYQQVRSKTGSGRRAFTRTDKIISKRQNPRAT